MKLINFFLGVASIIFSLTGCFDEKMPEVNDINCQHENVLKIKNKSMQKEFVSRCLRAGEFKASPEKHW